MWNFTSFAVLLLTFLEAMEYVQSTKTRSSHEKIPSQLEVQRGLLGGIVSQAWDGFKNTTIGGIVNVGIGGAKAVVSKVESLSHAIYNRFVNGVERVSSPVVSGLHNIGVNFNMFSNIFNSVIGALKSMIMSGIRVGKQMVLFPVNAAEVSVNALYFKYKFEKHVVWMIPKTAANLILSQWKFISTVQFPGHDFVMYLPNKALAVVGKGFDSVFFVYQLTGKAIRGAEAIAIYASLRIITASLTKAMVLLNLNCIRTSKVSKVINRFPVDSFYSSPGLLCGLSSMVPDYNITVTDNDDTFLIVNVPYILDKLTMYFKSVNVTGFVDDIFENVELHVKIKRVTVTGTVAFNVGTILRFLSVRLRIKSMDGFQMSFGDGKAGEKTYMEELVEALGKDFTPSIIKRINQVLKKKEDEISRAISAL